MLLSRSFSSLIENNNTNLNNTAADLLNGLKVFHNNQWYICGNLALTEGQAPHKLINSSPNDMDYQLLTKAAMLLVADSVEQPVTITTGFPYATYRIYKDAAIEHLKKTHVLEYDSSTFGSAGKKTKMLDVGNVDVIPEIVGCSIALRKGEEKASGNFFILSCGFGTFESILSTDAGVIEQSMISTHGLRYAINFMINELSNKHYLGFRTAHTLDEAFQKGSLYIDKKNVDVREIRRNALKAYYSEVISPALRNVITDKNLTRTNKVYLCGGGMYYQDLVDCFSAEFGEILQMEVVSDPASLASKGYALNSHRLSGNARASVGIDIGNSTTVVTSIDNG
ncbi:ParM/StbA family protein [Mucilaginibacter myungsuensis]|uniref:ParM/StbA family protein n=1 Tax=Mucilaginibacter myungsuensis TaxID=649104 RepID=A0A929KY06_9SPHI|nr:ParM/StbA family protein [Mucilaginibacter myungsuensis]MBE9660974.1 ParM/StbA family protein [Mucilaginibacter myungsuensis]MDN3601020.1 ParM/StbA family protein [Mucilaginibacter myungsuensis]